MKVLVTGDTGFIGSNLKKRLSRESVELIGFSRRCGFDVLSFEQVVSWTRGVDLVYHLAAYARPAESVVNPVEAIETNIRGTVNVLEACRKNNFTLIYPSTCEIYGDSRVPICEDHPINPPNPYASSKAACDRLCYSYARTYKLDIKIVRLFNPYGPYQQLNKIIPTFYFQAKANSPITVYGDGTDARDYVFIDDIVEGLWLARLLPSGEAVNLATGEATTNLEMALLVKELLNSQSQIIFTEYPKAFGGIKYQVGSYRKAKELLGWEPKFSLKEGLKRTLSWLDEVYSGGRI
ncbi:MAG: NAD-dependent epimerase/dehydratase family protein [Candidatus Verstraetearchaeota archaeon]|nr:NAD-dependent epimerase/dehydratase family protein [Candidatus Verstraetearchaeota archaeon]